MGADGRPSPALSVRVIADGSASGGAYAVLDVRARAGATIPPHSHSRQDGTLVVLAGAVQVSCGHRRSVVGAGGHAQLPRSTPCSLLALSDAHLLVLGVPAGLESIADLAQDAPADPDDLAALLAAAGVSLLPAGWRAAG